MLSKLFAGMNLKDQAFIAKKYDVADGRTFASWLRSLNFIRNVSAHYSRLWNCNILELSPVPTAWKHVVNNKPFLYFCFMQQMLKGLCPNSSWSQRFKDVLGEFPFEEDYIIRLRDFGLVEGWQDWDIWK